MPRKRRLFERAFKAKVALDTVRGMKTVSEQAAGQSRRLRTVFRSDTLPTIVCF